ncbi:MAG: hypothetical protein AB7O26_05030 [Planctomycetaceae bacterium]
MPRRRNHAAELAIGALSGAAATLPMTAAMLVIRRFLPQKERGALEPHRVTSNVLQRLHLADRNSAESQTAATTLAHFGYGAANGALFAIFQRLLPIPPIVRGLCYGLGLCGASYAGWIPALGILPAPTKRPMGRNILLVAAHAIWGSVLGYGLERGREALSRMERNRQPAARRSSNRKSASGRTSAHSRGTRKAATKTTGRKSKRRTASQAAR